LETSDLPNVELSGAVVALVLARKKGDTPMKICLAASLMVFLVTTAAVAAEEFYVVKNPKTGSCKISNKADDGQHVMIGTSSYPTAEKAKAAKNAAPECKEKKKKQVQ
jgi:hypothetical protein